MSSEKYFKYFAFDKRGNLVWKCIAKYLQKYIKRDSRILDLGAGYCYFINNIKAKEKHALDIFEGLKKYADKDVKFHLGSATKIKGIESGYFDYIFASNFFEHLKKDDFYLALKETRRILKKNGKLIIIQPNFKYCYKEYFDDYTHEIVFTDLAMCNVLKSFWFKIEKNIPRFLPFSMESKLPITKFLVTTYLFLPFKPFAKQMLIIAKKI